MKTVMIVVKRVMCEFDKNKEEYVRCSYENERPRYFSDLEASKRWLEKEFDGFDTPVQMFVDKLDGTTHVVGYIYPEKHKDEKDYEEVWVSFYWIEDMSFEKDLVEVSEDTR